MLVSVKLGRASLGESKVKGARATGFSPIVLLVESYWVHLAMGSVRGRLFLINIPQNP